MLLFECVHGCVRGFHTSNYFFFWCYLCLSGFRIYGMVLYVKLKKIIPVNSDRAAGSNSISQFTCAWSAFFYCYEWKTGQISIQFYRRPIKMSSLDHRHRVCDFLARQVVIKIILNWLKGSSQVVNQLLERIICSFQRKYPVWTTTVEKMDLIVIMNKII